MIIKFQSNKNKILLILIIGIILRILLSAITFHPDILAFQFSGWLISSGHILDIYDYVLTLPQNYQQIAILNYPPLIYIFHGLFNFIFKSIGLNFINDFMLLDKASFQNPLFTWHLIFLKLPYLVPDLIGAFIFKSFFTTEKQKILAFFLWIFNPLILFSTYMMGQFDIIPTTTVVIALFLAKKNKLALAALILGLGASFKIYPIFFLFPLVLVEKNWIQRIKIFILGLLPYLLSISPFLASPGFRSTALVANQTDKSFYAKLPISGGESIILFPAFLLLFYIFIYYSKNTVENLWKRFFIIILLFFIFTHYHPQWFLWVTPFFIISLIYSNFKNGLVISLCLFSFLGSLFFFDPSLTLGLFSPIFPDLYQTNSLWQTLGLSLDYNFYRSILQTIFVSPAIYLIYTYFPIKSER